MFGNEPRVELDIPEFIEEYNLWMCGVDIADQLRSYYNTERVHRKTWKPLFSFLLNTIVGNSYLLSTYKAPLSERGLRATSHLQFRRDLRDALLHASIRARKPIHSKKRKGTMDIVWRPVKEHQHKRLWKKQAICSSCAEAKRGPKTPHTGLRKPLADLSMNTTMKRREDSTGWKRRVRPPRTSWGCSVCNIPFCTKGPCWSEHLAKLNTKD